MSQLLKSYCEEDQEEDQELLLKHISDGSDFALEDVLYGHQQDVAYIQDGMYITSSFQERSKNLTS